MGRRSNNTAGEIQGDEWYVEANADVIIRGSDLKERRINRCMKQHRLSNPPSLSDSSAATGLSISS